MSRQTEARPSGGAVRPPLYGTLTNSSFTKAAAKQGVYRPRSVPYRCDTVLRPPFRRGADKGQAGAGDPSGWHGEGGEAGEEAMVGLGLILKGKDKEREREKKGENFHLDLKKFVQHIHTQTHLVQVALNQLT